MKTYLALSLPEQHFAPDADKHLATEVIISGSFQEKTRIGRSSLLFSSEDFRAEEVFLRSAAGEWRSAGRAAAGGFTLNFFTEEDRILRDRSYRWLADSLGRSLEEADKLYPFLVVTQKPGERIVYHHLAAGKRGNLFSAYHWSAGEELCSASSVEELIRASWDKWVIARPNYNNNCYYTKWRRDVEIERKYTFERPVDTWLLIQKLYASVAAGGLPGYILEFNDEFQVWDYENYMFEILEPEEQIGYISFVPQANGLMTVKQKTFKKDAEIRTETIKANVAVHPKEARAYAEQIGTVRELPPYRRKRFDINIESLETGNIYGIFMDLCRPLGDAEHALYQCEVEYIRSRVMNEISNVMEDYAEVCAFTKAFLEEEGTSFEEGYYSKLSYLRDYLNHFELKEV
ncbi:hypothetical protein [Paenibacillus sp. S150]|uniref:hypothetical protein n=1 Tax=Paenibacillus sp. S150 TaxID=2749826 RepID=UPI001C5A40D2|nr:hypothetical protein [Paenibacillus sp. S150]MBW4082409.1 hypothetical protein [Paenibacillus sp. S150]